jgi:glycosyltransferase involved in cell wall biosynthesis
MGDRLRLDRKKISVVPMGIDVIGLEPSTLPFDPPVIGFLSRMSESSGLDTLADAFIKIKRVKGFERALLRLAGGFTGDDRKFLRNVRRALETHGRERDTSFIAGFDKASRTEFFRTLTVFSIPSREEPAFGMPLLEAMAAGVPVVQPSTGAYPELVRATGGGITYEPNTADALSERLVSLLRDPERARTLGRNGRTAVLRRFKIEDTVKKMIKLYAEILGLATDAKRRAGC